MLFAAIFGDFNTGAFEETLNPILAIIIFFALIFFTTIICLNALIAFISDIFERILADRQAVLTCIKARCIVQLYPLLGTKKQEKIEKKNLNSNNVEDTLVKSNTKKDNKIYINLKALDKITAKTSDLEIAIGKKKTFGYLEILPKNCKNSLEKNNPGVVVYLQVKDLSDKRDEKIFVFNGWTFSSSPTLRPFDHPVYDLWVTGCENI